MTLSASPRPASKDVQALGRRFKQGYKWDRSGGGHYRILDRNGRFVEHRGRPISVSGNASPGVVRALEEQLVEARVLRGSKTRVTDEAKKTRNEALRKMSAEQAVIRSEQARALRTRLGTLLAHVGGLELPGLPGDLGYVGALVLRDTPSENGKRLKTPDLLSDSARRMLNGAWVEPEYAAVWEMVAARLEHAPDVVGEWYNLVREARGLPSDSVEVRIPKDSEDDWPFRVGLLSLDSLLVDTYQRPVAWPFVRREAARFDPSLVGTIDVAQRSPSQYAILDGQQRSQIVRLVGKGTIWASIYVGLDLASEARFFLHKNRDRKIVHPYYTFRAMLIARDPDALSIDSIVTKHGYTLAIGAPTAERTANIAAIAAVMRAYERKLPDGGDTLDPTLQVLKQSTKGRDRGQESVLIRGVSSMFVENPDLDRDLLTVVLAATGPDLILGRARDHKRNVGGSAEQGVVAVLTIEYAKMYRARSRRKS